MSDDNDDVAQEPLDVPDGMTVTPMQSDRGPVLVFYTGRFACEYDKTEVQEFINAMQAWLKGKTDA